MNVPVHVNLVQMDNVKNVLAKTVHVQIVIVKTKTLYLILECGVF